MTNVCWLRSGIGCGVGEAFVDSGLVSDRCVDCRLRPVCGCQGNALAGRADALRDSAHVREALRAGPITQRIRSPFLSGNANEML